MFSVVHKLVITNDCANCSIRVVNNTQDCAQVVFFFLLLVAVVDGDSLQDIYSKVKNVIHEQSGNHMWVPSSESI